MDRAWRRRHQHHRLPCRLPVIASVSRSPAAAVTVQARAVHQPGLSYGFHRDTGTQLERNVRTVLETDSEMPLACRVADTSLRDPARRRHHHDPSVSKSARHPKSQYCFNLKLTRSSSTSSLSSLSAAAFMFGHGAGDSERAAGGVRPPGPSPSESRSRCL
jgi:hypothetical protein